MHVSEIPAMLLLIVKSAFMPTGAEGAFIGGTAGAAFAFGMKRAIFSNEAGQGSSPMAHAAAKTDEPVREGIVAGLEPFIDTIVVCTFTALIILATGVWNRAPDDALDVLPTVNATDAGWQFEDSRVSGDDWRDGERVVLVIAAHGRDGGFDRYRLGGTVMDRAGSYVVSWDLFVSDVQPSIVGDGLYRSYVGAALTAKAFDSVTPGLGKWLITIAAWMFAISTIISWAYYGEQGVVFLAGEKPVLAYRIIYCILVFVATLGFIESAADLDNFTGFGTGVLVCANIPICWFFGYQAMRAYKDYIARLKAGRMGPDHPPPSLDDLLSGRDIEK
jgi:AGCS family alanine or glycine:cation symporter